MRFECREIELSRIDLENRKFKISTEEDFAAIRESLEILGVVNPPVIFPENEGFIVVSGFKRLNAARELRWEKIPARIPPPETPVLHCVRLAVADNSLQRPLNIVETAKALALLETCLDNSEIPAEAASLGLPANTGRLKEIEPLHSLPEYVLDGVLDGSIAAPVALDLSRSDEKEASAFADVFLASNCSLNKQREIMTLAREIGARDDRHVHGILSDGRIGDIVRDPDIDKNTKARKIRTWLRRKRYPNIVEAENAFAANVAKMKLGKGIELTPPRNFEGASYRFSIDFKNLRELEARLEKLREAIEGPEIEKILS